VKGVDTNILIRVVTADDPRQSELASRVVRDGAYVTSGVWMETEWVLRSSYRLSRQYIANALEALLVMDGLETADRDAIWWAIRRYRSGADWADMVHLVDSAALPAFATFDRELPSQAGPEASLAIEVLG